MKCEKLAIIHRYMIRDMITRYTFEFKYSNNIVFDVIFIVEGSEFELLFGAKGTTYGFIAKVRKGYLIETYLQKEQLNNLKLILNIPEGKFTKFSTKEFFNIFCANIPDYIKNDSPITKDDIRRYNYDSNDKDGYFFRCWRDNNKSNQSVSPENLEKTKRLLGYSIYLLCKKHNLSSCWSQEPNKYEDIKIADIAHIRD